MSAVAEIVASSTPAEAAAHLAAELRTKPWRPLIDACRDGSRVVYLRSTADRRVICGRISVPCPLPTGGSGSVDAVTFLFVADCIVSYELSALPRLAGSPPSFRSIEDVAAAVVVHDLAHGPARTAGGRP